MNWHIFFLGSHLVTFKPLSYTASKKQYNLTNLVCKASNVTSHQTMWHDKRISIKPYSIPWSVSWVQSYKLALKFPFPISLGYILKYCKPQKYPKHKFMYPKLIHPKHKFIHFLILVLRMCMYIHVYVLYIYTYYIYIYMYVYPLPLCVDKLNKFQNYCQPVWISLYAK